MTPTQNYLVPVAAAHDCRTDSVCFGSLLVYMTEQELGACSEKLLRMVFDIGAIEFY